MDKPAPPPYEHERLYGPPANGQPPYGPPIHGQPPYGPPVHGQPGYGPPTHAPQPGPSTTVVVTSFGPQTCRMTCPHCHALIDTTTERELSPIGLLSVLLLFGSLCCCIPCCIDSCNNVKHNCPNCRAYLGQYKP
ncbi:lipopolysaccharide-induced tumor necrosis factor-alpha factor homolog [Aphidius gifuensis]|uniref:lipopolysaccharide-induced tumor necrosis factor-alpha factor homolog n=1 Tax=Aphidius gifuensis TaxID=684658 RepID=UPI001CDC467A|nr:lipopolysaccharide-induced tumor necrosis factor-alpha factor homolog [Aphidius gifuensis]